MPLLAWSARSRGFPSHLIDRLVLPEADVKRVAQEVVGRPRQIGDLGDQLWLDPMHAKTERAYRQGIKPLSRFGCRLKLFETSILLMR
jgi:hypothetical protein